MSKIYLILFLCFGTLLCNGFSDNITHNTNNNIKKEEEAIKLPKDTIDEQIQKYFDNDLEVLVASFKQHSSNDNKKCKGTIYILRNKKKPQMRVAYENGPVQDIVMEGRYISIINRKTQKAKSYSILTTPLYALLSGKKKFSEFKPRIMVNKDDVTVIIKYEKQYIILVFSTKITNNVTMIDKLIAWTIEDNNSAINVGFDEKKYYVNDRSRLPSDIFTIKCTQR